MTALAVVSGLEGRGTMARRRAAAVSVALVLMIGIGSPAGAGTLGPGGPEQAAAASAPVAALGTSAGACSALGVVDALGGSGAATTVRISGASTSFAINALPTSWWRKPPVPNTVWQLYFLGLMWFSPVMARNDPAADRALVQVALSFTRSNPDRGLSSKGWDEGTNLRRQQQLNCLYRRTRDARLIPAIEMAARANLDATRYYGLPRTLPHNHGLMANLALIETAGLLGRPAWRVTATQRLIRDSGAAFTTQGVSVEQSSEYWKGNVQAWSGVVEFLRRDGSPDALSAAKRLELRLATARSALAHATDPSGTLIAYGDSNPGPGVRTAQSRGVFRDDAAGLVTGRWSWTDPSTTFYAARYGGPRVAHGHEDRGSLVWQTAGLRILTDPGRLTYDKGRWNSYQLGAVGHSTFLVGTGVLRPAEPVRLIGQTASGPVHTLRLSDRQYGVRHTRTWSIDHARHTLTVVDTARAKAVQSFVLDPAWQVAGTAGDRRTVVFRHSTGTRLVLTSTRPITVLRGRNSPIRGWVFPTYGRRISTCQVLIGTAAGTTRTKFRLTG